jgi:hypothetical protein
MTNDQNPRGHEEAPGILAGSAISVLAAPTSGVTTPSLISNV